MIFSYLLENGKVADMFCNQLKYSNYFHSLKISAKKTGEQNNREPVIGVLGIKLFNISEA